MAVYKCIQITKEDLDSTMKEINKHDVYYAIKIFVLKFPKCCRITVKRVSDNPENLLDQKLEITGTASIEGDISVKYEPFLVDLLRPPDEFKQHHVLPGIYL